MATEHSARRDADSPQETPVSPNIKIAIIAYAFLVNSAVVIWTGIQLNATSLGLSPDWYSIVLTVVTTLNLGASGLLAYLGLQAPTVGRSDG